MKELVELILQNLVNNPDQIEINESSGSMGEVVLEVKVNPEDMGIVIGKSGKVIKAIRNIVRTKAILEGKRVNLNLIEVR